MKKIIIIIVLAFILSLEINAQIEWSKIDVSTQNNLNEICFINDSIGFIAGDSGTILRTVGSGFHWQNINAPNNENIISIAFTDENNGAVLSSSGVNNNNKFHTTLDGGITWEQKYIGNGGFCFPETLQALNDKIIIGGKGCFYGDAIAIYQNDTFTMDTMLDIQNSISHFDFINENIGFASSTALNSFQVYSKIYKTIDGGFHWIGISNNDSIEEMYDIAFQDELIGFCVGKDTLHSNSNYPSIIYKTTDGGNTWNDYLGALFVTPKLTDIEFIGLDSFMTVGFYDESFMDNGTIWLNFSDTNLQWFNEDITADTTNPKVYKNDVLEHNNCIYIIGNNGFLATTCKFNNNQPINIEVTSTINKYFVFPNPANDYITFKFLKPIKKGTLLIYNEKGALQKSIKLTNTLSKEIDVSFFQHSNIYYYSITISNKIKTKGSFIIR